MAPEESKSPTVLVTGASSGIGREFCRLFARDGYDIVMVARDEARMKKLEVEIQGRYANKVRILPFDLAQPGSPQKIYDSLKADDIRIDILVNNAGFGQWGRFQETEPQRLYDMIEVNITALTKLTRLFLPEMIERGSGKILNVASSAGFVAGPYCATYYASKAYVIHLSEAIAEEVDGSGVTVTVLCPGPVRTEFFKRSEAAGTRLEGMFPQEADKVARIGYKALMKGRRTVIPSWFYKALVFSIRLAPRKLATKIARWQLSGE
ncbi:MAG TPA: SDR family oxidoreductase [candidate division Zixibacteria bacterium]|nr:SDR family oxidoreductase [candidate division Zixibacteria bacterium]